MVGEIHLANIYFTDASIAKVRPVLLLKPNSFSDVLYMPLTSNSGTKGTAHDTDRPTIIFYSALKRTSLFIRDTPPAGQENNLWLKRLVRPAISNS